jgi:hypothetical protein
MAPLDLTVTGLSVTDLIPDDALEAAQRDEDRTANAATASLRERRRSLAAELGAQAKHSAAAAERGREAFRAVASRLAAREAARRRRWELTDLEQRAAVARGCRQVLRELTSARGPWAGKGAPARNCVCSDELRVGAGHFSLLTRGLFWFCRAAYRGRNRLAGAGWRAVEAG